MADAETLLFACSPEGLIDTYAALTHRLHVLRQSGADVPGRDGIIAMRDNVRAELLRRMKWPRRAAR